MGGGFKNKNVTLSPRLKTITRTKIITFKTNHQSASPDFEGWDSQTNTMRVVPGKY